MAVENLLCEIADMPGADMSLYDRLMAVKPEGLTPNGWAVKAGVSRNFFNDVRRRGNANHESLEKVLEAIGVSWAQFDAGDASDMLVKTEVRATGLSAHDVERQWFGPEPQKPVPLLGTAFGGELEDGVELTELHFEDVIDRLGRPDAVAHDPHAYAVEIVGDSMKPRYEPGERVIVSPRAAVHAGNDVIVQLRAGGEKDEANQAGDRIAMVLIKRLVRQTSAFVELEQFNPPKRFQVARERVAAIHRVRIRL